MIHFAKNFKFHELFHEQTPPRRQPRIQRNHKNEHTNSLKSYRKLRSQNDFKADVMIDKTGKETHAFKAGNYKVAVKVVDNEGIESVEIITLKTNGFLETGNL